MHNDDVYAAGILTRALDPSSQPQAIRAFFQAENDLIQNLVRDGMKVVDIGCGTGRHLMAVAPRTSLGLGVDYQRAYITEALKYATGSLHFVVADGRMVPTSVQFDLALCVQNTIGTIDDKTGILAEMRRLSPNPRTRVLTVYGEQSISPRREWYARLGHDVTVVTREYIATREGFRSEHFSEHKIRSLMGDCEIRPLGEIGYAVFV